jgi:hypothetical protein
MPSHPCLGRDRGQILPLFVLSILAIIAMVALVIEGGNVLAQQRVAQNGADAAAMAGAIVVAENLAEPGSRDGSQVLDRVAAAAAQTAASPGDDLVNVTATYTDGFGNAIGAVTSGAIPGGARGVNVAGTRLVGTTIARAIGIDQLPATADATAIAGIRTGPCPPDTTCSVLPITMPVSVADTICDEDLQSLGMQSPQNEWETINDPSDPAQRTAAKMSVLPLCITGSGDFSWLDLGPDNLQQEILNPSGQTFLIPDWLQTQTGNPNSAEGEINTYRNMTVLLPMWQGICGEDPGGIDDPCPQDPPKANGNNTWYAIPYMRPFYLEGAYIQGDNRADCEVSGVTWPAETTVQGLIGCLKGWWLNTTVTGGPIDPNRPIEGDAVLGVQLIK